MQDEISRTPSLYMEWVEVIFFYFREMAAFPATASSIWICCWEILNLLGQRSPTLAARSQMAGWAAVYEEKYAIIAREHIKHMPLVAKRDQAIRSLILSTALNQGQDDFESHVINAFKFSAELAPIQKLQAYINYYCKIETSREILDLIVSALNWSELSFYRAGKLGLLEPVIWTLQEKNNYEDFLFLLRCLKGDVRRESFQSAHAFALPNINSAFTVLRKSEKVIFPSSDNGENYVQLMQLCNRMNGVAISIRGEKELGADVKNYDEFGIPSREGAFEDLRLAIVKHYHLGDDFYRELGLLTFVPSHNHPIQGAFCSLGHVPPLLSTSLEDLVDEVGTQRFVFFYHHQRIPMTSN